MSTSSTEWVTAMPDVWVVGVDTSGDVEVEKVRVHLGHGDDPLAVLGARGFIARPRTVVGQVDPHILEIVYDVEDVEDVPDLLSRPPAEDPGLVRESGEVPTPYQRVAVYGLVRSERGILVTQNSALTNAVGAWGLAGGGLDPGELPEAALHREVWEETGQRIDIAGLTLVSTRHWVGRAPSGRLEDFHAVRLVYAATCPDPSEPVVHDVGGTTAAAAWAALDEVADVPFTPGWRELILGLVRHAG